METRKTRLTLALVALVTGLLLLPGTAFAAKSKAPKVDLNTASQKELEELPGVGAATASKIIAGRPYSRVSDLEKAGVSKSTIDKIEKLVTVSKAKPAAAASSAKASEAKAPAADKADKSDKKTPPSSAKASAGKGGLVDLNTASQKELEDLPGVGPATAKKIIAGRPYSSVDNLAKAGVSKSTIAKISSQVTVGAQTAPSSSSRAPAPASSAPSSAAPSSTAPSSTASSSAKPADSKPAVAPKQAPPAKGMVWVNTATKIYHYEGDRWYGNTKEGKYMTEDDAIKAGYRASKEGQKKQ